MSSASGSAAGPSASAWSSTAGSLETTDERPTSLSPLRLASDPLPFLDTEHRVAAGVPSEKTGLLTREYSFHGPGASQSEGQLFACRMRRKPRACGDAQPFTHRLVAEPLNTALSEPLLVWLNL